MLFEQSGSVENEHGGFNWTFQIEKMYDGYHVTVDTMSKLGANCAFNETYRQVFAEKISTDLCRQNLQEIDDEIEWNAVSEFEPTEKKWFCCPNYETKHGTVGWYFYKAVNPRWKGDVELSPSPWTHKEFMEREKTFFFTSRDIASREIRIEVARLKGEDQI